MVTPSQGLVSEFFGLLLISYVAHHLGKLALVCLFLRAEVTGLVGTQVFFIQ